MIANNKPQPMCIIFVSDVVSIIGKFCDPRTLYILTNVSKLTEDVLREHLPEVHTMKIHPKLILVSEDPKFRVLNASVKCRNQVFSRISIKLKTLMFLIGSLVVDLFIIALPPLQRGLSALTIKQPNMMRLAAK